VSRVPPTDRAREAAPAERRQRRPTAAGGGSGSGRERDLVADLVARARDLAPLARACADEAERERRLPARLARALAEAGLHRVAAPREVGGAEVHPATQIEVIEVISEADGAAGWNLMIGIENQGFLGAALRPGVAKSIFADPGLVVCGALNPLGRAVPVDGGFRVSGQWPFASGCQNADYFWGQCVVHEGGERSRDAAGHVRLREALVPASEFDVVDTWHVSGLRGSGSHDVAVRDRFVPDEMTTAVMGGPLHASGPLFRLPPFSRLAYNKVGVATGIARAALDHFVELASHKTPRASSRLLRERPSAQLAVAEAEATLRSARAWVLEVVSELWDAAVDGRPATSEQRALVQLACSHAASAAVSAVERVHAVAGASANFTACPLERCFRDVQVVRQHIMVSPQWTEAAGRILLGLDSDAPIL
jgi:alkylation response protein AidB-like acyl-CoA dehydrogenase